MSFLLLFLKRISVYSSLVIIFFVSSFLKNNAFAWSAKGDHNIYVGINAGTMGLQGYGAYYYKNLVGIKFEGGGMPKPITNIISEKLESAVDDLTLNMHFWNYGVAVSVRPLSGCWYIDAGVKNINYSGDIGIMKSITGRYAGIADVYGETTFKIAKGFKPYLEMGWNFNIVAGLNIDFSVGIIYTGKWKAEYPRIDIKYNEGNFNQFAERIANEEGFVLDTEEGDRILNNYIDDIANEIEDNAIDVYETVDDFNKNIPSFLKFWPVVKLGLSYRFDI